MVERGGAPEYGISDARSVPVYRVRRHLLTFLQWQFSKHPIGAYRFVLTPDGQVASESEIFIGGDTPINPEVVGMRPTITISRGAQSYAGMSLNDKSYEDLRNGTKIRLDLTPVTYVMNCLGRTEEEAESIAYRATKLVWAMRDPIIVSEPALHLIGHQPQLGAPSPAGALVQGSPDLEWVAVVVNFPCYLVDSVTTQPLNKRVHQGTTVTIQTKS